VNLLRINSEHAWIAGVVASWCERLRRNPRLRMCLPSGRTPEKIYAAMAIAVETSQASFRNAEVFALDEFGGLPKDDPGRCVNMLRRQLTDHVDLPRDRFHIIDVDAHDLENVCRNYDRMIGAGFDLVLLGIGRNGHLGMNEPGSTRDSVTRRVDLAASTINASARYLTHQQLPTWGVTVGMKLLLASKEVWLLANGHAKAKIVARAVKGEITTEVPASLLREHRNGFLFVDADAGALL
jgi:glucosamine-6-phosphate deaminase